jgi:NADH-quinone oxidoreductase subunit L
MMVAILTVLTIGLPWLGAALLSLIKDDRPRVQQGIALSFAVLTGLVSLALLIIPESVRAVGISLSLGDPFGAFTLSPDGLGVFMTAIACVIGCLAVIFSMDYMRGESQLGRYYGWMLFFIGSMAGLVLTSNMLLLFVFWEITSLCSYALISFHSDDPKAVAGGIKAIVITQIGGIGLLVGALLLYANTGSYDFRTFLQNPQLLDPRALSIMAFGLLIAAAAKSAQFPFQTWLPDAMEAPTPVSALIHAATMVNAGVYVLNRFYPAFAAVPGWRDAVVMIGVLSATLAGVMALVANDLKRVLAYSTISQLGYMVYAVGVGDLFASQFHLLSHAVFKALLFLSAGAVIHTVDTRDMRHMGGLGRQMPFVRNVFIIGASALAGLPLLNGFWSKELVLEAGLEFGLSHGFVWAYIAMLLGAGLTALYTFRCVWLVFYGEQRERLHGHDAQMAMRVALVPLAAGTLTTWLLVSPEDRLLNTSLKPFGNEILSLHVLLQQVLGNPATLIALLIVGLGLAAWWWRDKLSGLVKRLRWVAAAAVNSFGFEAVNGAVVRTTVQGAEALRVTQTGVLNWNVLGIVAGLLITLIVLITGA